MKIKTIYVKAFPSQYETPFDAQVNKLLSEGWILTKREIMRDAVQGNPTMLYAELVLPDPPAEPEPQSVDPFEALRIVRDFCDTREKCGVCPLYEWCCQLRNGGDPTDWRLPGEEADQ